MTNIEETATQHIGTHAATNQTTNLREGLILTAYRGVTMQGRGIFGTAHRTASNLLPARVLQHPNIQQDSCKRVEFFTYPGNRSLLPKSLVKERQPLNDRVFGSEGSF